MDVNMNTYKILEENNSLTYKDMYERPQYKIL